MKKYSRVCAKVDLDAVEYNIEKMKENLRDGVKMTAVLKADGYGHGAVQIARLLSDKEYIWGFAVATADEAVILRKAGITKPLIVLGSVFPEHLEEMIRLDVRMTVYTKDRVEDLSKLAEKLQRPVYIHVKIDTGMSRLGYMPGEDSASEIASFKALPYVVMEGMYTHFAKADETDKEFTKKQMEDYLWMKDRLQEKGVEFAYYHCSNSAGIIDIPEANLNLVRAGIATYGLYPSEEVKKENVPLKPALELISHVAHVKWVEPGTPVSYGSTFVTEKKTKIVTVPVGYGDGYPRSLSNRGYVLIKGNKARILGRVCMDQFMVDATKIEDVKYGDEVVLIGSSEEEILPVETLSVLSERFNYEFVCDLGKRIPREYIRGGEVVEQADYFA